MSIDAVIPLAYLAALSLVMLNRSMRAAFLRLYVEPPLRYATRRMRPDYAAIDRMERDIFGETFEHDGAPPGASRTAKAPLTGGMLEDCSQIQELCDRHQQAVDAIIQGRQQISEIVQNARRDDEAIRSGYVVPRGTFVLMPSGEKIDSAEWARRGGRTS